MIANETKTAVQKIPDEMLPQLDDWQRRLLSGSAASAIGYGGIAFVNEVSGSARNTIAAEKAELAAKERTRGRIRGPG